MANYSTYGEFLFMDNLGCCYLIRKAHNDLFIVESNKVEYQLTFKCWMNISLI